MDELTPLDLVTIDGVEHGIFYIEDDSVYSDRTILAFVARNEEDETGWDERMTVYRSVPDGHQTLEGARAIVEKLIEVNGGSKNFTTQTLMFLGYHFDA